MQDDTLSTQLSYVDIATKENLENLVKVGEELLKKPVSRVNNINYNLFIIKKNKFKHKDLNYN